MSLAKPLRYFIALLILLYLWMVVIPSIRNVDRWSLFGLMLIILFSLGFALRGRRSARSSRRVPAEAQDDSDLESTIGGDSATAGEERRSDTPTSAPSSQT